MKPIEFFYECCKCKARIPSNTSDDTCPVKTIQKGNEYTFVCETCSAKDL